MWEAIDGARGRLSVIARAAGARTIIARAHVTRAATQIRRDEGPDDYCRARSPHSGNAGPRYAHRLRRAERRIGSGWPTR
jgi:hypothetical protein